jgi:hypothetical protein
MFIEKDLEGSSSADENNEQGGEKKGRKRGQLKSIIAQCESVEKEMAREKVYGLVPGEMESGLKRLGAVRALAETMLEGMEGE